MRVHEDHTGGGTSVFFSDDNLYIMQRSGIGAQRGLIFVMNNRGDARNGTWIPTQWKNTKFSPAAWRGRGSASIPQEQWTNDEDWGQFHALPRGYSVYVPRG